MTSYPPPGYEPTPDGRGMPGRRGSGSGPGLDPLSRILVKIVVGLAVLLIVVVGIAIKYDNSEVELNAIAEAAQQTASMTGAKMTMSATYSTPGHAFTFRAQGAGAVNWRTERGQMRLTIPIPGHEISVEAINDATTIYMRTSVPDGKLPPGKEWVAVEPFLGHDPGTAVAGSTDAAQTLRSLEACGGKVEDLGEETIRGVATTRYRGTIELARLEHKLRSEGKADVAKLVDRAYSGGRTSLPVEVWIDGNDLVRQVRQEMPIPGADGATDLTVDMQIGFYDFGTEPEISLPPADTVFDATPLVKAKLGVAGGSQNAAPTGSARPASGEPLSRVDFHSQVKGICVEMVRSADRLKRESDPLMQDWKDAARRNGLDSPATLRAGREVAQGYFEPITELASRGYDRLSSITPPTSMAAEYRRYLRIGSLQIEKLQGDIRAMEIGDYGYLKRVSGRYGRLQRTSKRLADDLGVSACEKREG